MRALSLAAFLFAACSPALVARDAATSDTWTPPPSDASPALDAPDPTLVSVSHPRELRGAWVPSVWNLVFPTRTGLSEAEARAELEAILDVLVEVRMNAIFLQIRPESDALYASDLEPWSRFLSGTQGRAPGYDPLALAIEEAHARGIEVHAWMNPYRGMASAGATTAEGHVTRTLSAHVIPYGTQLWMDPGAAPVREHVVAVVRDVVRRYDVDGIHFDDYFYPYPIEGQPFPDGATYEAYRAAGGTLSLGDWRRDNVHQLVRAVHEAITALRDDVRFGISPFGIYRPGMPEGIRGLDAYEAISCDPLPWLDNGWIDYLAPQLYWPTTQTAQAFVPLLEWWTARTTPERPILAGMNLVKLGETAAWSVDEFRAEYEAVDARLATGAGGSIVYTAEPLLENRDGIRDVLRDEVLTRPAAPPRLPIAREATPPAPPSFAPSGGELAISHPEPDRVRWVAIYDLSGAEPVLDTLLPGLPASLPRRSGAWAVSVIDRRGLESVARRLELP